VCTGKNLVFPETFETQLIKRVRGSYTGLLSSARIPKIVCLKQSNSWNIENTCNFPRNVFVDSQLFSKSTAIISLCSFTFVVEVKFVLSELETDFLNFKIQGCKVKPVNTGL
jgi:hypothetical protein